MGKIYAVKQGRQRGIFSTWDECKNQVHGFPGAMFKSFGTLVEANEYMNEGCANSNSNEQLQQETSATKPSQFQKENLKPFLPEQIVYTDGCCHNNGFQGARAGIGVYFGPNDPRNVSAPITGPPTNNRAELIAMITALSLINKENTEIFTDSMYVLNGITSWIYSWKKNGWCKKAGGLVLNADLWKQLDTLYQDKRGHVRISHVKAHIGIEGNEIADALANRGAEKYVV